MSCPVLASSGSRVLVGIAWVQGSDCDRREVLHVDAVEVPLAVGFGSCVPRPSPSCGVPGD